MSTVEFRLPDVGEGIQEAEIVKWLVQEGERIQEFDPLVEVQTDKALVELPAPTTGYIEEIVAVTGSIVRVGDVLVRIGSQKPASAAASGNGSADDVTSALHLAVKQVSKAGNALRLKATPGVRHYARALGVPLTALQGTGPGGRITKQDVDHYLHTWRPTVRPVDTRSWADDGGDSLLWSAVKQAEVQRTERTQEARAASEEVAPRVRSGVRIPFRGVRRATAEHVKRSFFSAPHVTAFDDCDATELVNLRARWNKELEAEGKHVTYLPFLVKATVSALKAFPFFNACLDEAAQEIELISEYHIGIAVDSADGLFVPVIRNADQLSIREIADEIARLTEGVRLRSLSQDELRGSTFTITNLGTIGGMFVTPILNYPEVGILAVHKIQRKPVVVEEQIVIRDVLTLSLSFDHRVIDGATSIQFMNHLKHLIEHPDALLLELR